MADEYKWNKFNSVERNAIIDFIDECYKRIYKEQSDYSKPLYPRLPISAFDMRTVLAWAKIRLDDKPSQMKGR